MVDVVLKLLMVPAWSNFSVMLAIMLWTLNVEAFITIPAVLVAEFFSEYIYKKLIIEELNKLVKESEEKKNEKS